LGPLKNCLDGLAAQDGAPDFEVVVVDDGSESEQPKALKLHSFSFPIRVFRQEHAGLPGARNAGILLAQGSVVLFTDADCILEPDCLRSLNDEIIHNCGAHFFQLRLKGDGSHLVGQAEHLHLTTVQAHKPLRDGQILYLNTSGFALCRTKALANSLLFDPRAVRAEDTLLLWKMVQSGESPHFAGSAGGAAQCPVGVLSGISGKVSDPAIRREQHSAS
jgi:cellulose synthase/poly-beta-1,6-N-acetylglucosamine synthase-like glycosyltransferase